MMEKIWSLPDRPGDSLYDQFLDRVRVCGDRSLHSE